MELELRKTNVLKLIANLFLQFSVPSWPLQARAVVMTLSIENRMEEVGKFLFKDSTTQDAIDDHWEHTQLRVVKERAMVVCR